MINKETKNIIATEQNLAMAFIKKVRTWIEEDKQNSVYLYGAGKHLHWVVLFFKRFGIPIKMIIDTWKTGVYDDIPIVQFEDFRINY